MIPNYPYFGLPNYMRYMNPGFYPHQQSINQNVISNKSKNNTATNNVNNANLNKRSNNTNNVRQFNYNNYNRANSSISDKVSNNTQKSTFKQEQIQSRDNTDYYLPIFSLMGINIYFDDVLIVCILFFLYNENVNDPYLFFVLVLLLMT